MPELVYCYRNAEHEYQIHAVSKQDADEYIAGQGITADYLGEFAHGNYPMASRSSLFIGFTDAHRLDTIQNRPTWY